ncbi:MAG: HD domain-containing protein [Deltaproteobacteria bacterium]|nr:HD domain-containing protein [Deltaproteobacteria bacterium]
MIHDRMLRALADVAAQACAGRPPAHDFLHVERVAALARTIGQAEGARVDVVVAAALLHELINLPKDHPESHRSGDLCAEEAMKVLAGAGVAADTAERVAACIRDHAFSKGAAPPTFEAAVLQDADRLDAIGAIGVARCFATCSEMKRPFYAPDDPFCEARAPDDKLWGLDHFFRKLLRIEEGLHTETARAIGRERTAFLRTYLARLEAELAGR